MMLSSTIKICRLVTSSRTDDPNAETDGVGVPDGGDVMTSDSARDIFGTSIIAAMADVGATVRVLMKKRNTDVSRR